MALLVVLGHLVDTLVSPPKQAAPFYFLQEPFPRPKRRTFDVQDRLCTSEGEGALRCEENTRAMVRSACARRSDPCLIRNDLVASRFTLHEILGDPREVEVRVAFLFKFQKDCEGAWRSQFALCRTIGRKQRCKNSWRKRGRWEKFVDGERKGSRTRISAEEIMCSCHGAATRSGASIPLLLQSICIVFTRILQRDARGVKSMTKQRSLRYYRGFRQFKRVQRLFFCSIRNFHFRFASSLPEILV